MLEPQANKFKSQQSGTEVAEVGKLVIVNEK
jgi:hypothetical protein